MFGYLVGNIVSVSGSVGIGDVTGTSYIMVEVDSDSAVRLCRAGEKLRGRYRDIMIGVLVITYVRQCGLEGYIARRILTGGCSRIGCLCCIANLEWRIW